MTNLDAPDKYCQEGPYIYDDGAFTLYLSRFGVWKTKDRDGKGICSGMNKDSVIYWAREHLNGFQTSGKIVTKVSFGEGYKL